MAISFSFVLTTARWHPYIQIARICSDPVDRTPLPPEVPAHHPNTGAVTIDDPRNVGGLNALVARCHLER
jgi:hypothetical protein